MSWVDLVIAFLFAVLAVYAAVKVPISAKEKILLLLVAAVLSTAGVLASPAWNPETLTEVKIVGMTGLLFSIFSWLYYSQSAKFPFFKYLYFKQGNKLFVAGGYVDSSGELLELAKLDKQLKGAVAFFWVQNNYDDIANTFREIAKISKQYPTNAVLFKKMFQSQKGAGVVFSSFSALSPNFVYDLLAMPSKRIVIAPAKFSATLKAGRHEEIFPRIEEKRGSTCCGGDVVLFGLNVEVEKMEKFLKQRHNKFELIGVKSLDELIKKRATC